MTGKFELTQEMLAEVAGGDFDQDCHDKSALWCSILLYHQLDDEYSMEEFAQVLEASQVLQEALRRDDAPDLAANGGLNDTFRQEAAKYLKK